MTLANSYPTETAAIDALKANGFVPAASHWVKSSVTGGNLFSAPRACKAICSVRRNAVDPIWNSPDYFTVEFI